jgi:hypothetical protein
MSTANKYMQSASGVGGVLNVEDVFSTYLHTGNGSTQTITNNVDLSGEGGLVWIKSRAHSYPHALFDTERGATKQLKSSSSVAERTLSTLLTSFNNNGFSLGSDSDVNGTYSPAKYASWTFRKAPKFFDVVTYTGDGTNNRQIAHDLDATVGMVVVKRLDSTGDFFTWHRTFSDNQNVVLNDTFAVATLQDYLVTTSSTTFTVGSNTDVNANGGTYVAYLWAHNNNDGEFGPDSDQDIIKCGSYTGNTTTGPVIDLGFEPQWLLIKPTSYAGDGWFMFDSMRGIATGAEDARIYANNNNSENAFNSYVDLTATGFKPRESGGACNSNGENYIYIAIRRGPMAVPESATEVFDVGDASETGSSAPEYEGGFVVDMAIKRTMSASQQNYVFDRLRGGNALVSAFTNSEAAFGAATFDYMNGYYNGTSTSSTNWSAMWKRAPNYFDVVAYTGLGTAGSHNHNLLATPEMAWFKARNSSQEWIVYHKDLTAGSHLKLNGSNAELTGELTTSFAVSDTQFTFANDFATTNSSSTNYIAYLFASLDGISKVGSYSGSASAQTIDCGFTAGARFVLIKRTDQTGSWVVWDTNRGIVAGNDPYFQLDSSSAPTTTDDYIDPHNSGFTIAGSIGFINTSGGSYIFYAIA